MKTTKIISLLVLYLGIIFNIALGFKGLSGHSINATLLFVSNLILFSAACSYVLINNELNNREKKEFENEKQREIKKFFDELTPQKFDQMKEERRVEILKEAGLSDREIATECHNHDGI